MTRKHRDTILVVTTGIVWLAITVLAWTGHWFGGLFLVLLLIAIYTALGGAHSGRRVDLRLLWFPTLPWLALWALTFVLAEHYAQAFAGGAPSFALLGLHPSFAWVVLLYWLASALVMTLGYYFRRETWLSDARWDEFVRSVRDAGRGAKR